MEEKNMNMTDEQLAQELRKSKGGKLGGKVISLLGAVIAVAGIILNGNIVLVVIGGVILAGLYALFNTTVIPTLTSKIGEMFNYGG